MSELLWRWGPVAAYVSLIYSLSLDPGTPKPGTIGVDKILHVFEYSILGLLLARGAGGSPGPSARVPLIIVGLCIGIGDELIQSIVPSRTESVADGLADIVGVIVGVGVAARVWDRAVISRWV